MAYIPAGGFVNFNTDSRVRYPFLLDRLETTVAEYAECVDAGSCSPAHGAQGYEGQCTRDAADTTLPISCVDRAQAIDYCQWRSKRLPTALEWLWAAQGGEGRKTPWGGEVVTCAFANTAAEPPGCGHGGPWPVGSAPEGASRHGVLDLLGNVAEHLQTGGGMSRNTLSLTAGRSWWSKPDKNPLRNPFGAGGSGSWSHQIGIRCAKDGVRMPPVPPGMHFVPDGGAAEFAGTTVDIDAPYFYDTDEATVASYRDCVDAKACSEPHAPDARNTSCTWSAGDETFPVNCIDHDQAQAFCAWRGLLLPSAAQWKWASQSTHYQRWYPWGTGLPNDCTLANMMVEPRGCGHDGPWPAGSVTGGASVEGIHDLYGNVAEWTSTPGDAPSTWLHAGRGWRADLEESRPETAFVSASGKTWADDVGVRCVGVAPEPIPLR